MTYFTQKHVAQSQTENLLCNIVVLRTILIMPIHITYIHRVVTRKTTVV